MQLTPREKDKLLVAMAAEVARKRLARGVKLNHPEAIALITDAVVEGARDGRSVADMMEAGAHVVTRDQVMEGIAEMILDVQVEATTKSWGICSMATSISRRDYADMFGPTVGDKLRLADTDLIIEVERDLTAERANGRNGRTYGEEVKFGGGKVIRDGMGQSQATRAQGAVDTVITNALIVDHSGIYKADVGLRDGRIHKIGKAGNPDTQPGVDIIIGPGTEAIAGEGRILTAGGFDSHIHFICPQQIEDALHSGLTTMLGGGTGPAHGTLATTCTPGPWHIGRMLQAADAFPMNLAFAGKGNASQPDALVEMVNGGA